MKPFDLKKALVGVPLVLRDGRKVTDFKKTGGYYSAKIEGERYRASFFVNGKRICRSIDDPLFMEETP